MKIIKASHLDHGLTEAQVKHIENLFRNRDAFFIETVELPSELGNVPCGLHGPLMGDDPVPEDEVEYVRRGERAGQTRMCKRGVRNVSQLTVIAGPHKDEETGEKFDCVLYTAFGGPLAPKEPFDASPEEKAASDEFWSQHAISAGE